MDGSDLPVILKGGQPGTNNVQLPTITKSWKVPRVMCLYFPSPSSPFPFVHCLRKCKTDTHLLQYMNQVHSILWQSYKNFWDVTMQETQSMQTFKVQPYSCWRWRRCNDGTSVSASGPREGWSLHHWRHPAWGPQTMCPSFSVWEISHRGLSWHSSDIQKRLYIYRWFWWWQTCGYERR